VKLVRKLVIPTFEHQNKELNDSVLQVTFIYVDCLWMSDFCNCVVMVF